MKKKNTTVRKVQKSDRKIEERGRNDTPNTNTWPLTFFAWYVHFNKKKNGRVIVVLWVKYFLYYKSTIFVYQ